MAELRVTRRTALKSIAAALMAPTIKLRREIDRESLMMPFCGWDGKYDLESPFQCGSLTYASDAYRIIRAELASPEVIGERRLPPAKEVWDMCWHPVKWTPLRKPEISELVCRKNIEDAICPACDDQMVPLGDTYPDREFLEDITGRGIRWDVDENEYGDESCPICKGKYYSGPDLVRAGADEFAFHLLKPIWDLPGDLRFSMNELDNGPILFRADGFEGMVMPLARRK